MNSTDLLHYCQGNLFLIKPKSKEPQHRGWRIEESLTVDDASGMLVLGYNIGYRIPEDVLVIDVDPRNGGDKTYEQSEDLRSVPATTVTPGGGFHIYTQLPAQVDYRSLRAKHRNLPGVDFKRHGGYVLLPESTLIPGNYTLGRDAILPPPSCPRGVLDLLVREANTTSPVRLESHLSNGELATALENLPVLKYNDNDSWLSIMLAAHHASGGEGLEAFLTWSMGDLDYYGQEDIIRKRWQSATAEDIGEPMITIRTLCHAIGKHSEVPQWLRLRAGLMRSPETLFSAATEESEAQTPDPSSQEPNVAPILAEYQLEIDNTEEQSQLIPGVLYKIAGDHRLLESYRELLYSRLARKAGVTLTSLRKDIKQIIKELNPKAGPQPVQDPKPMNINNEVPALDENQTDLKVSAALLDYIQESCFGVRPVFCGNEWWLWRGQCWVNDMSEAAMGRACIIVLQNMGLTVNSARVLSIINLSRIQCESPAKTFFHYGSAMRIFAKNGVLLYDYDRKQWTKTDHSYQYRNLAVINATLKDEYTPPQNWLNFLNQAMTSEHAQRSLACAIIYAASGCSPWMRKSFILYGPKRSGKSTCLDTLELLLGRDSCCALSITQLSSKNGPALLTGKLANISNETASKKKIEDDIFKALISGESIVVENKYAAPFVLRNTAKFFFAMNNFPRVGDESDATWDRIVLLSFPNSVPDTEADYNLAKKLYAERDDILTWALQIFTDEYQKDECRTIMLPDQAGLRDLNYWRRVNDTALQWFHERIEHTNDPESAPGIDALFQDYTFWCQQTGHYKKAKNTFSRSINNVMSPTGSHNNHIYPGVKLRDVPYFNNAKN